jgi:C4-type Zn-finger protein
MSDERPDDDAQLRRRQYPIECPACQKHAVTAKSVSTVKGQPDVIRLHMFCPSCAHSWFYDKIDDKVEQ